MNLLVVMHLSVIYNAYMKILIILVYIYIYRIVDYSISVSDFHIFNQVGYYAYMRGVPVDICTNMVVVYFDTPGRNITHA